MEQWDDGQILALNEYRGRGKDREKIQEDTQTCVSHDKDRNVILICLLFPCGCRAFCSKQRRADESETTRKQAEAKSKGGGDTPPPQLFHAAPLLNNVKGTGVGAYPVIPLHGRRGELPARQHRQAGMERSPETLLSWALILLSRFTVDEESSQPVSTVKRE